MNTFTSSLDDEQKIVRIIADGVMMKKDIERMITLARQAAVEYGFNILYDLRNATTKVPFAEWYYIPRNLEVFKHSGAKKIKGAMVILSEDKAFGGFKFYETVADNLGFRIRIFFDETEALNWLNEINLDQEF